MKEILSHLVALKPLSEEQTHTAIEQMMGDGEQAATDAQIAAYLFATACRTLSADELVGAAKCLRRHMAHVSAAQPGLLDTCGTGGSGYATFNTSTAVAFVCAAAGQPVAKHGNRASTSKSGSADVLEALGLNLQLSPERIAQCIAETGYGFMFAPLHHSATKRVAQVRREVGFRTIFNFIGPLCNPAQATYQLLGVSAAEMVSVMAEAVRALGIKRALVVRGEEGLDEISLTAPTQLYEIVDNTIRHSTISPEDFGLSRVSIEAISVASPEQSAEKMREVFAGGASPYRDLVALNAGAALYVSGHAADIAEGVRKAQQQLESGAVQVKVEEIVAFTNGN